MDNAKHRNIPMERLLPRLGRQPYPALMTAASDMRRLRVADELWDAYTEIVGNAGRSADLKSYIEWRVDNPTTPLPGRRRGPVRKHRDTETAE